MKKAQTIPRKHIRDDICRKLCERAIAEGGYTFERRKSGHFALVKPGQARPLIVPFSPKSWKAVQNSLKTHFRKEPWWHENDR